MPQVIFSILLLKIVVSILHFLLFFFKKGEINVYCLLYYYKESLLLRIILFSFKFILNAVNIWHK